MSAAQKRNRASKARASKNATIKAATTKNVTISEATIAWEREVYDRDPLGGSASRY